MTRPPSPPPPPPRPKGLSGIPKSLGVVLLLIVAFGLGYQLGRTFRGLHEPEIQAVVDREYYPTLKTLLSQAQDRIDLLMFQLFDYEKEDAMDTVYRLLIDAYKRGVEVRVLTEGGEAYLGESFLEKSDRALAKLQAAGIEIRLDPPHVTTHAKLCIVDDQVLLGSTNWNYYAFFRNHETNVRIRDPLVVRDFEAYFNRLWREAKPYPGPGKREVSMTDPGQDSPIARLLKNKGLYDGRKVTLQGRVENLQFRFSQRGNPYTIFRLRDRAARVRVYMRTHPTIAEGDSVQVSGTYHKERKVGRFTYRNEIEADQVVVLNKGGTP